MDKFEKQILSGKAQKKYFWISGMPKAYEGITFGDRWNGHECPFFKEEDAQEIISEYVRLFSYTPMSWVYKEEIPAYFLKMDEFPDEVQEYPAFLIDGSMYFPLGNGDWVWQTIEKPHLRSGETVEDYQMRIRDHEVGYG